MELPNANKYFVPRMSSRLLLIVACLAPALVPTAGVIASIHLGMGWHAHLYLTLPALTLLGVACLHCKDSLNVWLRACGLFLLGLATAFAVDFFCYKNQIDLNAYWYLLSLIPAFICLLAWQDTGFGMEFSPRNIPRLVPRTIVAISILGISALGSLPLFAQRVLGSPTTQIPTFTVIQVLEYSLPKLRFDDRRFFRHLLSDIYFYYDPVRVGQIPMSASMEQVLALAKNPDDQWSHAHSTDKQYLTDNGWQEGFGIGPVRREADGDVLLKVTEGSPAHRAGLRRGDKVLAIDDLRHNELTSEIILNKIGLRAVPVRILRLNGQVETLQIARVAHPMQNVGKPLFFEIDGRRIGYLTYDSFAVETRQGIADAMREFRFLKISELILDLRHNPGGDIVDISLLGGMLVAPTGLEKTSIVQVSRIDGQSVTKFHTFPANQSRPVAAPTRLIVITSERTCSASENLIQSLRAYMPVITIGAKTCGKPVGTITIARGTVGISLVNFLTEDANRKRIGLVGIDPTCDVENDVRFELGDPRESSLAEALHYARYGECSDKKLRVR